jgi:hypothetical protein
MQSKLNYTVESTRRYVVSVTELAVWAGKGAGVSFQRCVRALRLRPEGRL